MAVSGRVQIIEQVSSGPKDGPRLCLQWCRYVYDDGNIEEGYRFIYRREDGSLQGARGQARLPSLKVAKLLMKHAEEDGWGERRADDESSYLKGVIA